MQVVRENIGNLNEIIKITVEAADYTQNVEKALKDYKKKANVPGFRPGMVPMGIIKKMYLKGVTADETYKMASQECYKYLTDNKIEILGDPLPSETQPELDFEQQGNLEFHFEIGVSPEINIDLSSVEVTNNQIGLEADMVDGYKKNYLQRFGKLVDVAEVTETEAITGTLTQGEETIEEAYVGLISMSDEQRAPYIGKKVGDVMEVNVNELYTSEQQRATILKKDVAELADINPNYTLTITQIRQFELPEVTEELLAEAFPNSDIKTPEQFDTFANEEVQKQLDNESKHLLAVTIRRKLIELAGFQLPDTFLKKWIYAMNEGKYSNEEIENEYAQFTEMMSWDIIKRHYVVANDMKVERDDLIEEAKQMAKMQFIQYGMPTIEDSLLVNYANQIISNKDEARKLYDAIYERMCVEFIESKIKVENKTVTVKEFGELIK